ncbi:hypothetical protein TNCV_3597801 [Trichonephila clavipes]|nr:hypothetical protein TNCV_3597801 [Trichonephila clavipes]
MPSDFALSLRSATRYLPTRLCKTTCCTSCFRYTGYSVVTLAARSPGLSPTESILSWVAERLARYASTARWMIKWCL